MTNIPTNIAHMTYNAITRPELKLIDPSAPGFVVASVSCASVSRTEICSHFYIRVKYSPIIRAPILRGPPKLRVLWQQIFRPKK